MSANVKVVVKKVKRKGAPAYMVSFGGLMTLVLCFFILLVSLASEQSYGMVAKGLGSFVVAIKSHGLNGVLSARERQDVFNTMRRRFNLPPEEDPDRRETHELASVLELVRANALDALRPHDEVRQPRVATFERGSATLSASSLAYLDLWADAMRPGPGQLLVLEGHALDAGRDFQGDDHRLAFARADVVRKYLVEQHGFETRRVEARAWLAEVVSDASDQTRSVDARLILPARAADDK